jgi:ferrous iron transport protein B
LIARVAGSVRTVVLVGRQNAGKTSLLMHLTGSPQRPVNFPGTSVERIESSVRCGDRSLRIVDLPGVSSLTPASRDEQVAIDYLADDEIDLLCVVLDATKLSIELRLLDALRHRRRPMIVALTKVDVASNEGRPVDVARLQHLVGLPVFAVNGFNGRGCEELRDAFLEAPAGADPDLAPRDDAPLDADAVAAEVQPGPSDRPTWSDRLDSVALHPIAGPTLLLAVILAMFQVVFTVAEPFMGLIEEGQGILAGAVESLVPDGALQSFFVDGLVNGLGSALVFVPQIALLIALITVLESSGYMARAVFLLDRLLGRFGLTGRSFVPLTSSFACAIPGILGSRIISDERDRIATIVVSPLMSCSARLPVYVILLAAFFPPAWAGLWLFGMYLVGIVAAAGVAWLLRSTLLSGGSSFLAIELPRYQRPSLRVVWMQMTAAVREFLRTAGSIIFVASILIWAAGYYPRPSSVHERFEQRRVEALAPIAQGEVAEGSEAARRIELQIERLDSQEQAAYLEQSLLATVGKAVQPVFALAGFDWRQTVAILAAFPARELVIPTLGTLHSLGAVEADPDAPDPGLIDALRRGRDESGRPTMNALVALAMMVFFALCSQCVGTLAAIYRETHSVFWPVFTFTYMTALAWAAAVGVYQIGSLFGFGIGS